MSATLTIPTETRVTEINRIFELQQKNQFNVANNTASQRYAKLEKLHQAVLSQHPIEVPFLPWEL